MNLFGWLEAAFVCHSSVLSDDIHYHVFNLLKNLVTDVDLAICEVYYDNGIGGTAGILHFLACAKHRC